MKEAFPDERAGHGATLSSRKESLFIPRRLNLWNLKK